VLVDKSASKIAAKDGSKVIVGDLLAESVSIETQLWTNSHLPA
jgi:hypothetical protein